MAGGPSVSRTERVWLLLPYALLLVSALLTVLLGGVDRDELPVLLGGSLVVVAWHSWWALRHRSWLETRVVAAVVYFVGLVAVCALLLTVSFNFLPLYVVCFPLAFEVLPGRWAYAGVALVAGVIIAGPGWVTWSVENVVVTLSAGAVAATAGWSIRRLEEESARRRAAVEALAAANADLARAAEANRVLQDRLVSEARTSGVSAERARLAGEIHDTLAADLAGVVAQLEALDAELAPDHPARDRVRTSVSLARDGLAEARRSVHAMRPAPLAEHSLPAALGETAARVRETHGLPVDVTVTGEEREVDAAAEDVLVRAAREALTNVVRHASAGRARVTLSYLDDSVALDVADDGDGFAAGADGAPDASAGPGDGGASGSSNAWGDDDRHTRTGHGLAIMRERASEVGGFVVVDSTPGEGAVVTVTVPTRAAASRIEPAPTELPATEPTGTVT
ncbi:sensor histidine kinase [Georgenia sp. Z1344]|uniref:sensor histidine kinase n=1 Tax=Georgenia sp. Z1344 TaxID=3416706 RepID=UPI003CF12BF3